jgi:cytochrome P450
VIEAKRAASTQADSDPIAALIAAQRQGDISEQELHGTVMYLFVTSAEPVTGPVAVGVYTLTRHPDQLDQLKTHADDALWDAAVWELVRYHHNSLISLPRMAIEDLTLHGVRIKAGDAIVTPWVAATWDPEHYHEPERFSIHRSPKEEPAITFGTGPHFCLGANIARMYLHTALRTLFERLPGLTPAAQHEDITWEPDEFLFTRPTTLPITW